MAKNFFKFCLGGEILPSLVTLLSHHHCYLSSASLMVPKYLENGEHILSSAQHKWIKNDSQKILAQEWPL